MRTRMQIHFKPLAIQATSLHEHVVNRARLAFRRFADRIPKATIQLSDLNGPRGGIDKRCQIELHTLHTGTVIVSGVASDWRTSINKALAKVATLMAQLKRKRSAALRRHSHDRTIRRSYPDSETC